MKRTLLRASVILAFIFVVIAIGVTGWQLTGACFLGDWLVEESNKIASVQSELLTRNIAINSAARQYASGDRSARAHYDAQVAALRRLLESRGQLVNDPKAAIHLDEAYRVEIELERAEAEAFRWVPRAPERARLLLESRPMVELHWRYLGAVVSLAQEVAAITGETLNAVHRRTDQAIAILAAVLGLMIVIGGLGYVENRHWKNAIRRHEKDLMQRTNELDELNRSLDTKVRERTAQLERANRKLHLLQQVTRAIGEAADLPSALATTLRLVGEATGFIVAEAWVPSGPDQRLDRLASWVSPSAPSASFLESGAGLAVSKGGIAGRALASGKAITTPDLSEDPDCPRREAAAKDGVRGGIGVPVFDQGAPVAVLDFFKQAAGEPDGPLVELISAIALQVGSIIARKHAEEARRESEAALRDSVERHRQMFATSLDAIAVLDAQSLQVIEVNPACVHMYGYSAEEMSSIKATDLSAEPDLSLQALGAVLSPGAQIRVPMRMHRRKDGSTFPVEITLSCFEQKDRAQILAISRDIGARIEAEKTIRRRDEQLVNAQRVAHLGSWELEIRPSPGAAPHVQTFWSDETFRICGLKPGEVAADFERFIEMVVPNERDQVRSDLSRMLSQPCRYGTEYHLRRPDGEVRIVAGEAESRFDGQGVIHVVGTMIDITDRRRSERLIAEWKQRFEFAAQASRQILYDWDAATGKVALSNTQSVLGIPPEAIGTDLGGWVACIHPEDRKRFTDELDRVHKERRTFSADYRIRTREGHYLYVEDRGYEIAGPDGSCERVVGFVRDVTEKHLARIAVQESEKRLRKMFESPLMGIAFWEASGLITQANGSMLRMLGYTQADIDAGRFRYTDATPPEYEERDNEALAEIAAKGSCQPYEKELFRKDGQRVRVLIAAASIDRADSGVAFFLEVTGHRRLEARMRQSEKLAALGQLAAGVAHELNNPLTGIMGFAQMLMSAQGLSPLQMQDVRTILTQSQRCRDIIQNLLAFSRPRQPKREAVPIVATLRDTVRLVRYEFQSSGITIEEQYPDPSPVVYADVGEMQQIFLNLITNARHAMEAVRNRSLIIGVSVRDDMALVKFQDSGEGISPDNIKKIFDPFFTTKAPGRGTGLGLSVTHSIVEAHGGRLNVESQLGQGTTFTLELPLFRASLKMSSKAA